MEEKSFSWQVVECGFDSWLSNLNLLREPDTLAAIFKKAFRIGIAYSESLAF